MFAELTDEGRRANGLRAVGVPIIVAPQPGASRQPEETTAASNGGKPAPQQRELVVSRPTAAAFALASPADVRRFLEQFCGGGDDQARAGGVVSDGPRTPALTV
jgi:hypothetical protein